MTARPKHSDSEIAEVLRLDLWNEHHYQLTATADFYAVLRANLQRGEKVGDEAALTSALVHTRSLLEFYNPALARSHSDDVWWATALGAGADESVWRAAVTSEWKLLEPWIKPIHKFLAHISWSRRTLQLPKPPDANNQRWPLLDLTTGCMTLLDQYSAFVRANTTLGDEVIAAVDAIQSQTRDLWTKIGQ
jgi:hypothetical protein